MKKIEDIELVAGFIGVIPSTCACATVGVILGNLLPINLGPMQKIVTTIGLGVIGGYIGSKSHTYLTEEIKDALNTINRLIPEEKELYASQEFHAV